MKTENKRKTAVNIPPVIKNTYDTDFVKFSSPFCFAMFALVESLSKARFLILRHWRWCVFTVMILPLSKEGE